MNKYLIFLFIIFFSSCTSLYIPSGSFIPLMEEKKDLKTEGAVSTTSFYSGIAYSPIKHLSLKLNSNITYNHIYYLDWYFNLFWYFYFTPYPAKVMYFEPSLGFYNKFKNNFIIELYTGYGYGISKLYQYNDTGYNGFIKQPNVNLNFAYSKDIVIGGALKVNSSTYKIEGYNYEGFFNKTCDFLSFEYYFYFGSNITSNVYFGAKLGFQTKSKYYNNITWDCSTLEYSKLLISLNLTYEF